MTAFAPRGPLLGTAQIPGDKSISHRALMLAALAVGETRIAGLSDGADVEATIAALEAMGARISCDPAMCRVQGVGVGSLLQPEGSLALGNSGTSARLLMGLAASHRLKAVFTGDPSLSRRPMDRIVTPLRRIGARIDTAPGGLLPLTVEGVAPALPRRHVLQIPSAQVKSALLLAGLNQPGTTIVEAPPSRDHLERLLPLFGAELNAGDGVLRLRGEVELRPASISVAGDASAAAFFTVAALIVPGSAVRIENVGINPFRTGLYELLAAMGGDLTFSGRRTVSGEPVADLEVRHSPLRGCEVPLDLVPRMIDEFPILFIAAAFADGTTRTRGLAELRIKESDRLATMATGLRALGVPMEEIEDGLAVQGSGGEMLPGGANIDVALDHRIAMSFAVAGLHSAEPVRIDDMRTIDTSFPRFLHTLEALTLR
ncbi:MAG TPA: 3-phosphoshikimate 1-carboxyvinyltransferase [Allosphingosinicella sp.]|nr:3-phosphoshikimate 1-carboxyvinyltransferase [Allosphingosinicella sp.]